MCAIHSPWSVPVQCLLTALVSELLLERLPVPMGWALQASCHQTQRQLWCRQGRAPALARGPGGETMPWMFRADDCLQKIPTPEISSIENLWQSSMSHDKHTIYFYSSFGGNYEKQTFRNLELVMSKTHTHTHTHTHTRKHKPEWQHF